MNKQTEFAMQQFIGFGHASRGYNVVQLVEAMGLTVTEWKEIRKDGVPGLKHIDIADVEEYFARNPQVGTAGDR